MNCPRRLPTPDARVWLLIDGDEVRARLGCAWNDDTQSARTNRLHPCRGHAHAECIARPGVWIYYCKAHRDEVGEHIDDWKGWAS